MLSFILLFWYRIIGRQKQKEDKFMKIERLSICLKDVSMSADTPIAYCNIEEGILFLCPPPDAAIPGTVFAGTLSEWKMLDNMHFIYPKCTYLVCTDGETPLPALPADCACNLFILNASVKTILHKLTFLLTGHSLFSDVQQNQFYTDFWHAIMDNSIKDRDQATAFFQHFPYQMHTHMACIVVSPDSPEQDVFRIRKFSLRSMTFLRERISSTTMGNGLFYTPRKRILP